MPMSNIILLNQTFSCTRSVIPMLMPTSCSVVAMHIIFASHTHPNTPHPFKLPVLMWLTTQHISLQIFFLPRPSFHSFQSISLQTISPLAHALSSQYLCPPHALSLQCIIFSRPMRAPTPPTPQASSSYMTSHTTHFIAIKFYFCRALHFILSNEFLSKLSVLFHTLCHPNAYYLHILLALAVIYHLCFYESPHHTTPFTQHFHSPKHYPSAFLPQQSFHSTCVCYGIQKQITVASRTPTTPHAVPPPLWWLTALTMLKHVHSLDDPWN